MVVTSNIGNSCSISTLQTFSGCLFKLVELPVRAASKPPQKVIADEAVDQLMRTAPMLLSVAGHELQFLHGKVQASFRRICTWSRWAHVYALREGLMFGLICAV